MKGALDNLYSGAYKNGVNNVFRDLKDEIEDNWGDGVEASNARYLVYQIMDRYLDKLDSDVIDFFESGIGEC